MVLVVARCAAEIEALRSRWEALYAACSTTIFQNFTWNLLAARAFGDREAPYVVYAENGSGAALIPAAINRCGITFLGEALFDYRDVLTAGDSGALIAAWAEVARLRRPLQVAGIRHGAAGWPGFCRQYFCDSPGVAASDLDGSAFAAAHSHAGRLVRRLVARGCVLRGYSGEEIGLLRWIYEKKAEQFAGRSNNLFADPRRIDFMQATAEHSPELVEISTLENGPSIVAALVKFRERDIHRFYTIYFDRGWSRYSPGTALLFEVTRQTLAAGVGCDYMTGNQPHKQRFATSFVPLYRVEASAPALSELAA